MAFELQMVRLPHYLQSSACNMLLCNCLLELQLTVYSYMTLRLYGVQRPPWT